MVKLSTLLLGMLFRSLGILQKQIHAQILVAFMVVVSKLLPV